MVEKATQMLIKVDLQCSRCYKKIKKILCKYPQIRDQIYNEKQNMVLITVVCCSPEKIRQKIICKGGETVQSVEILLEKPPEKPKKPKETNPEDVIIEPPKGPTKPPATKPAPVPPPQAPPQTPRQQPPQQPLPKAPPQTPRQQPPQQPPPKVPWPVVGYPPVPVYPMVPTYPTVGVCCCPPCYGSYGPGPCYCGRRRPEMCHDGCGRPAGECQGGNRSSYPRQGRLVMCDDGCGRPACECPGGNRSSYVSPCDYFSEENTTGCTVM